MMARPGTGPSFLGPSFLAPSFLGPSFFDMSAATAVCVSPATSVTAVSPRAATRAAGLPATVVEPVGAAGVPSDAASRAWWWPRLQDFEHMPLKDRMHPYRVTWTLMLSIVAPPIPGTLVRELISDHPVDEMLYVVSRVYMAYYAERAHTLNAMNIDEAHRRYVPPEDAPFSVVSMFRDPDSPIYQSHVEQAAIEVVTTAIKSFTARARGWLRAPGGDPPCPPLFK